MTDSLYQASRTVLLLIDPYNDFLSEGGKMFAPTAEVARAVNMLANLRLAVQAARDTGIPVFFVPHHRAKLSDFSGWKNPSPYQLGAHKLQVFAENTWGGQWHPDFEPQPDDIIIKEHWNSSGFCNTDLDVQLRQHGAQNIILIGMIANTCLETTGKFGAELGYHVTLVRDATSAFSAEAMRAAHDINGPTYAHAILTTQELVAAIHADN